MDAKTQGMEVARLTDPQLSQLQEAEKKLNAGHQAHEIYLLALTRQP
ncbi:hypothetical protein [Desulfotomaculum copahuensis]|nr:hypothetical protein [Desulfotomaculum copahuensis]